MTSEEAVSTLSSDNLAYLCRIVFEDAGIVLDASKRYLLDARLNPVGQQHHLVSLNALCVQLQRGGQTGLRRQVVEAMTTNETYFFRDISPFEALRQTILPELLEHRAHTRSLSIWCAACSSGQEPYTVAMLLRDVVPDPAGWRLDILGTDLSEPILERARQARYFQLEVNRGLPAPYLIRHFTRKGMEWELKPELRSLVRFQIFNLKDDMIPLGRFDLVLCRNVMIYFDNDLKKKILAGIRQVLAPDGYLLLGGAETVYNLDDNLERRPVGQATFYQAK